MSDEKAFTIKVEGPGVNIEQEVEESFAKRLIFAVLSDDVSSIGGAEGNGKQQDGEKPAEEKSEVSAIAGESVSQEPELSIREFLDKHGPKRNVDKISTIALYLKKHKGRRFFTPDDLTQWFENAAEPVPGNMSRDLKWTVKNGWITPKSGDENTYYLTDTGKNVVENNFPDEVIKSTTSNR